PRGLCSEECSSEGAEIQRSLRGREAGGLDTLSFALIFILVQGVFHQRLFAAFATAHLYSTFVLQRIYESGAAIFSCLSAHFSPTAVIARRRTDFARV